VKLDPSENLYGSLHIRGRPTDTSGFILKDSFRKLSNLLKLNILRWKRKREIEDIMICQGTADLSLGVGTKFGRLPGAKEPF